MYGSPPTYAAREWAHRAHCLRRSTHRRIIGASRCLVATCPRAYAACSGTELTKRRILIARRCPLLAHRCVRVATHRLLGAIVACPTAFPTPLQHELPVVDALPMCRPFAASRIRVATWSSAPTTGEGTRVACNVGLHAHAHVRQACTVRAHIAAEGCAQSATHWTRVPHL